MKRTFAAILLATMVGFALFAGGGNEQVEPAKTTGNSGNIKALVVYFSRTGEQYRVGVIDKGNTAIVAEAIAQATGADMFEVLPEDDYYPMTYNELLDVARKEQSENARPAIKEQLPDLSQYDVIFLGAPVWWGDWPMIMYAFFESVKCEGLDLVPFCTHEGSGLSGFDRSLKKVFPACNVLKGLAIRGEEAQTKPESVKAKVDSWLSDLGF